MTLAGRSGLVGAGLVTLGGRAGLTGVIVGLLVAVALLVGCSVGTVTEPEAGPGARDPESGLVVVELDQLPPEAARTLELIKAGGPFPYRKDGSTFGNREGLLPDRPRGYYREYTVPTPGEDDRGARRIVTGDRDRIFYYTGDHYTSFSRIRS
ncbi:guanyl-specific ribonuclease [Microlunatus parietis]|uniref:Ribonuclease T1 n=1 Tax=Microlunatus parietis TaxID=682979 RepID=A0A7Y9IEP4_9ACTN|nr:ribonuclease domain-containing protein [Microlunatus parietis]NYE74839.1 ribonuclease T1 [Microlunatus parietis]